MKANLGFTLILAAAVQANPVDIDLMKRDTEIIYLANCGHSTSCCNPPTQYSEILYYPQSAPSNNGVAPSPANTCRLPGNDVVHWEGISHSCGFPTGVTFTSHIGAGSHDQFSFSGTGFNGHNWNCFRDNGRRIFVVLSPEAESHCDSVYWCTPQ